MDGSQFQNYNAGPALKSLEASIDRLREASEHAAAKMESLTRRLVGLTWAIGALTLTSVVLAAILVLRPPA